MKKIIFGVLAATYLVAGPASASFIMYLDDLSTVGKDIVVRDDTLSGLFTSIGLTTDADTASSTTGLLSYSGSVGGFFINATTALSKPVLHGPDASIFDLNSINVSGQAGQLQIGITDTGFTGDHNLSFGIGGTTDGSISASAYMDLNNIEFGQGTLLGSYSASGLSFSSNSATTYLSNVTNPFSLTLITSINHQKHGVTSFDAAVSVPEPSVIALFGLGLAGLGVAVRRRKTR